MQGSPFSDNYSFDIPAPLLKSAISPSCSFFHSSVNSGNLKAGTLRITFPLSVEFGTLEFGFL